MVFFPTSPKPQPADMNWSVLMYGFVTFVLLVYYYQRARHSYHGPVVTVKLQHTAEASSVATNIGTSPCEKRRRVEL